MRPALQLSSASCVALVLALLPAMHVGAAQSPGDPIASARLASPEPDTYATGTIVLRATADESASIDNVTFFIDGRQICIVTERPFECEWDAGTEVTAHQIRAVFNLPEGARVARTVRTKGL